MITAQPYAGPMLKNADATTTSCVQRVKLLRERFLVLTAGHALCCSESRRRAVGCNLAYTAMACLMFSGEIRNQWSMARELWYAHSAFQLQSGRGATFSRHSCTKVSLARSARSSTADALPKRRQT